MLVKKLSGIQILLNKFSAPLSGGYVVSGTHFWTDITTVPNYVQINKQRIFYFSAKSPDYTNIN